jgi:hypothetical protein
MWVISYNLRYEADNHIYKPCYNCHNFQSTPKYVVIRSYTIFVHVGCEMHSVWVSWHDMFCIFLDAEVPCHVISFPRHFTDDTGLMMTYAFFCFCTLQMTWEFAFFGYVRQLPCHLQVVYLSLSTAFFTILEQKNPHWFCWCRIKLGCSDGVKGGDGGLGSCRYADSVLMANELCRDQWHPVTHWQMSRHCRVLESPQKL